MIYVGAPPVEDGQEALQLMLHHLQLAAMYFEATDKVIDSKPVLTLFSAPAIVAWIVEMERLYPED